MESGDEGDHFGRRHRLNRPLTGYCQWKLDGIVQMTRPSQVNRHGHVY